MCNDRGESGRRPPDRTAAQTQAPCAGCVLVVDDDPAIREGLDSLFRSVGLSVELYGSIAEFSWPKQPDRACCLVLDVRLPGVSGLDFQAQLHEADAVIPIVFMSGHGDVPMSVKAMKAGAVDFLVKPFRDQEMLDAVAAALQRDEQRRAARQSREALRAAYESLSAREREVMAGVTAGLMNKQVAGRLGISEITVKIHRGQAMKKMQAKSLADLVRMAGILGLHD